MTPFTDRPVGSLIWRLDDGATAIRWSGEGQRGRVLGVDVPPSTRSALTAFYERGTRVIVIVDRRLTRDDRTTISQYLGGAAVVVEENAGDAITSAAERRGIFVSADRVHRAHAVRLGMAVAPNVTTAALAAVGRVQFCRVAGGLEVIERLRQVVYYHIERGPNGGWSALAALSAVEIERASRAGLTVAPLDLDLAIDDPVFVQIPDGDRDGWDIIGRFKIIYREPGRALLAVSAPTNDALPVHGAHGHFIHLAPLPFAPPRPADARESSRAASVLLGELRQRKVRVRRVDRFPFDLVPATCGGTAASFQADVDRFSGIAPLDAAGLITSRHILHPDNTRVVDALVGELRAIGYCAYRHAFTHGGRTLHNVIADLPGKGRFTIDPDILERIRRIFIRWPRPDPPDPWRRPLMRLLGAKWFAQHGLEALTPIRLRLGLEVLCGLRPWYPWWRCLLPGVGADLVLVGCHLDSTAASSGGFDPAMDPAPGADDDASGIAAVLAAARQLWVYRGQFRHTVRFCFFNAEEQGMIGSGAYASMLAAADAPVKAVICADMIGYNSNADRIFEVHAGYTDPTIRDQNLPAANVVAAWASSLGALPAAQIYSGILAASGADRTLYDGAINRSDHASFHRNGFPAVVVSEDFFANTASEPLADPNPNYHRSGDTVIDAAYGADIACVIVCAARELAS